MPAGRAGRPTVSTRFHRGGASVFWLDRGAFAGLLEDRQEITLQPRRIKTMQNIAEFRIIGRIGKIEVKEKVTYVSVASNYNRKDGDDWKTDTSWNSVTLFEKLARRLNASKGDLVHITGRVRQNNYEAGGTTHYGVDLIADGIAILAKKDGGPADDEKHD
jgi:single-strand DNA-binding protein